MKANWNTHIKATELGIATVAFNRAQEDLIDACADQQEGGRPNFGPIHARLNDAVLALQACGVDPYEEGRRLAQMAQDEANAYWEQQRQLTLKE